MGHLGAYLLEQGAISTRINFTGLRGVVELRCVERDHVQLALELIRDLDHEVRAADVLAKGGGVEQFARPERLTRNLELFERAEEARIAGEFCGDPVVALSYE